MKKRDLYERAIGENIVIYDPQERFVYLLEGVSGFIWNLCDGSHSPKELSDMVRDFFVVGMGDNVEEDTKRILSDFAEKGLLE